MQLSRKKQKQKAFLLSEKQNPPAEGCAHVSLDFADVVIDGMTGMSEGGAQERHSAVMAGDGTLQIHG